MSNNMRSGGKHSIAAVTDNLNIADNAIWPMSTMRRDASPLPSPALLCCWCAVENSTDDPGGDEGKIGD